MAGTAPLITDIDGDNVPELGTIIEGDTLRLYRLSGNVLSDSGVGAQYESYSRSLGQASVDLFGDHRRRITSLGRPGISLIGPTGGQERGFASVDGLPGAGVNSGNSTWRPGGDGSVPIWGDFDGDGFFEGVFAAKGILGGQSRLLLHAIDVFGNAKNGFPVAFGDRADLQLTGQILVHDLDGDGLSDLIVPFSQGVEVISARGVRIPSWSFDFPKGCISASSVTPAIADLNGDGAIEIIFSCIKGSVGALHALTFSGSRNLSPSTWPMFQHDPVRSAAVPGSGRMPLTPTPKPTATPVAPTPTVTPTPPRIATATPIPALVFPTYTPTSSARTPAPSASATPKIATPGLETTMPPGEAKIPAVRWISAQSGQVKKGRYVVKILVAIEDTGSGPLNCVLETSVKGEVVA